MKVAFWSNVHGQTGVTSNVIALALMQRSGTLRERVPMQLQDSRWQLTADSVGTVMNRQQIS